MTGFGPVPGGALPGLVNVTLAVSPDGSQVAIAGTPAPRRLGDNPVQPGKIVIVDLATGASRVWQGGMDRPGQQFSIPSVSWTADGKSLVYVAQWCTPQLAYPSTGSCDTDSNVQPSGPVARVQEISVAGRGGRLTSGEVLLRQSARYPKILQALVAPDGQLVALVAHGLHPYLVRFAVPSGRPLAVLYDGQFLHAPPGAWAGFCLSSVRQLGTLPAPGHQQGVLGRLGASWTAASVVRSPVWELSVHDLVTGAGGAGPTDRDAAGGPFRT